MSYSVELKKLSPGAAFAPGLLGAVASGYGSGSELPPGSEKPRHSSGCGASRAPAEPDLKAMRRNAIRRNAVRRAEGVVPEPLSAPT